MKLYYLPGACSLSCHVALVWTGAPYETQKMAREELKKPEYLALNPQGSVPCLTDGDFVLTQNVAILEYINEMHPEANIFGTNPQERALARKWLSFCNADVQKQFSPLFGPQNLTPDESAHPQLKETAKQNIVRLLATADEAMGNNEGISGRLSVADAYLFVILRWSQGQDIALPPNLQTFFDRMMHNPGVVQAMKEEGLI